VIRRSLAEQLGPEVVSVMTQHAHRAVGLQLVMRGLLVVFVSATLILEPPAHFRAAAVAIAALYLLAAVALAPWQLSTRRSALYFGWLVLYIDLAALSALALLTGITSDQQWTADVLLRGFFALPVMATTQLRPRVCASLVIPTTIVYGVAAVITQTANEEPSAVVALRIAVLAGLSIAAIGLTELQRSRVLTIATLVQDRTHLLAELTDLAERERREMAEQLHDGALQYILAARMDLEDLRDGDELTDRAALSSVERLDEALRESASLLRSTVTELHPAVLSASGLASAVATLATTAAQRAGLGLQLDLDGWPADRRDSLDLLLYTAAREFVANVVRHARASEMSVRLRISGGTAELTVADDGLGIDRQQVADRLAAGHIGLTSNRIRIEAAGGFLSIENGSPRGTVAAVTLPLHV
jgi:two-component system NarL family sensor kinase